MSDYQYIIQGEPVDLPLLTIVQNGVERQVVSQLDLLALVAERLGVNLDTEEGAAVAYDEEDKLAQANRLSAVVPLRPPVVPLARSGSYRAIPPDLPIDTIREAAGKVIDKLLTVESRDDWEAYIHIHSHNCVAPWLELTPVFLTDTARSLCEQTGFPLMFTEDVERALDEAMLEAGMGKDDSGSLTLDIPFNENAALERLETELDDLGDDEKHLWKLVEGYLEAGFGVSLPYRGILKVYQEHETPAWPLLDVIRHIVHGGRFMIGGSEVTEIKPGNGDEILLGMAGAEADAKEAWARYMSYGKVMALPFEFPDIESILETINRIWIIAQSKSDAYILEEELAAALGERYGKTVTPGDIQKGHARPTSFVYRAFRRARLKSHRSEIYHLNPDTGQYTYHYGYWCRVEVEAFDEKLHKTRLGDSSSNLPVYVMNMLAGDNNEALMLSLFGPRESVTAAFARLFAGSSRKKYATAFSVGGFRNLYPLDRVNYDHMRQRVPGTKNTWIMTLLAHQTIPTKFDIESGYFYLLAPEDELGIVPAHFLGMLDRAIMLPLLPSWTKYLWWEGIDRGLITPITKQIGASAGWKIDVDTQLSDTHNRTWQNIIRDGLKEGIIAIQDEEDIKVEAIEPEPVQGEITPDTYLPEMIALMREAAEIPVAGD